MKKVNLKKIGITAIASLAAGLVFGANVYPVVASAEETAVNLVTIDVTVEETQNVYSVELTKAANGEYLAFCEADESFSYTVSETDGVTSIAFAGLLEQGEWTYEMTYDVYQSTDGQNCENMLSVTKGADVVEVKLSADAAILEYNAYLQGTGNSQLNATLSEDGKTLTVNSEGNKAVAASDIMTVKIVLPDATLVEDFKNTLQIAEDALIPSIYLTVAAILLIALMLVFCAMLFAVG
ncbi:MAG: hypothetical protein IKA72_05225 [Clostridia bacterium]|nr:hypothetical protein [Clostridia bacterium]